MPVLDHDIHEATIMRHDTYGCAKFDPARLCRYDRRETDSRCAKCERISDMDYLRIMGVLK